MIIDDQDLYHGAALAQIARHPEFTAINVFKQNDEVSRSAFMINNDLGVYLKYASKPKPPHSEYQFNFNTEHFEEMKRLNQKQDRCFVLLVCVASRQICCITFEEFHELKTRREGAIGRPVNSLTVLAVLPEGKKFRVYVDNPGRRRLTLGEPILVARRAFPDRLFD